MSFGACRGRSVGVLAASMLATLAVAGCGVEPGLPGLPTIPSPSAGAHSSGEQPVGTISRGPYLQPADGGIAVVWYTREPTAGRVLWQADVSTAGEAPSAEGTRHEAVIAPLRPGARYTYRIHSGLGPLAAPGGAAEFSFRAPQADVTRFVVFGDSGDASASQQAVARAIAAEPVPPDFVLVVGDVNQTPPGGLDQTGSLAASAYDRRFFEPYAALLPRVPFYAALGNHDYEIEKGQALLDLLALPRNGPAGRPPESAYWLERAGAQMIVHDTNQAVATLVEEAVPWHREVARRPATFRLVFQHHPLYGSGPNAARFPTGPLRDVLAPLYTETGVDLVFNGHDHLYERTKPIGGVVYVTTGAGGAALYPLDTRNDFTAAFVNDRHGYTYVAVRGRTLSLRQMDEDRQAVDSFQLTKAVAGSDALRAFDGAGSPPRGWDEPAFDDSAWAEAKPTSYASVLRARRRFDLAAGQAAADAFLRVRGATGYVVSLNGVAIARGDGPAEAAFPLAPSLLRRGANVLALEGLADFGLAPSLDLCLVSRPPR